MALAGVTKHPDAVWMEQMARDAVDPDSGYLRNQRYILHDRDTKSAARPKLGPWLGIIDQILLDDDSQPKKQRHTAKRIWDRL